MEKLEKQKSPDDCLGFSIVAEWTGLEPATPDVTGRYSNQLNYHSAYCFALFRISGLLSALYLADLAV